MFCNPSSILRAGLLLAAALPHALGRAINEPGVLSEPRDAHEPRAIPPSVDPFYQPPDGFESKEPGDVLRSRRIIAGFFGLIPDPIEAYQVLYRTTAIDGSPIATVTTIFKPLFAKRDRFVAFNTAYDSSSIDCSPSYAYQLGSFSTDAVASLEFLVIQAYLASGYVVASSDYEGPDAAFSPGYLSGMGVLDGMRAVKNFGRKLGLSKDPMVVGTGYSGGGLATGWAAALQPSYAPELQMKGWVAGGIPANLTDILLYIDRTVTSGFEPIAVAGLLKPSAYGAQLQPVVDGIITEEGRKAIQFANDQCVVANLLAFPFQSILDTKFQSLGPELLYEPTVAGILGNNTLGINKDLTPTAPVMQYHATPDEIVPYGPADTLRQSWCDFGATVKFTNFAAGGHLTTVVLAIVDALTFTNDAFAGKVSPECSSKTVLDEKLNPIALGVSLEPILIGLINWLGVLGTKDENFLNGIKNGKPVSA
ncbi:hypothetical protein K4F52_000350 [Lecanicillium sp. MT-2017a]|nr:hypothetical protein K4F52_000350 [Lecanicillium sp. MT-2017a]